MAFSWPLDRGVHGPADTIRTHRRRRRDQGRSSPPRSNSGICSESLPSRAPAFPPVPRSSLMKEDICRSPF